jgi:hypothetical protein
MDLEAVGGAATGGLIGAAIEKPTGVAGEHHGACADCGTETLGRFCHNCGNPSHVHRTLLHLGEELLHGVMHFDSRTWRTVPLLLVRPGRLTREWVQGKRSRYVSPLALFLFTIFVMFMALSYLPAKPEKTITQFRAETSAEVAEAAAAVAKAETKLQAAPPEDKAEAQERLAHKQKQLADAREDLAGVDKAISLGVAGDWKKALKKETVNANFNTGNKKLDAKLQHLAENPELGAYKLQQTFYKFSFLLVPISIPFVAALFVWKRGFTLYDHGVFILYSLTFVSLLVMITAMTARLGGNWGLLAGLLPLLVPVHMYYQLQGAYGLRTFSTLWRTFVLLVFCSVALTLFVVAVLYLGFA